MAAKRYHKTAGIGGSLILIIFIVMTVTNFSLLTLVSSQNELGTVKKSADISTNYYNAEKEAAHKIAELKTKLAGVTDNTEITKICSENQVNAAIAPDGVEINFKIGIDENRSLLTVMSMNGGSFDIKTQKIVSEKDIIIDDDIDIWDGLSPLI